MKNTATRHPDGYEYLSPMLQGVVRAKEQHGFPIYLPNMGPVVDERVLTYIHAIFDATIEHFASTGKKTVREDAIFLAAFKGNRETASIEKLKFLHNVVGCHPQVIAYCEAVLRESDTQLPKKPPSLA